MLDLFYKILNNPQFNFCYQQLKEAEQDRIFCKHDIEHSLNLAKLCVFYCEKEQVTHNIDVIYSAALLHDIGRAVQDNKSGHEKHSVDIARSILDEIHCPQAESKQIISLIAKHRNHSKSHTKNHSQKNCTVEALFAIADKKSRKCYECSAQDKCKWPKEEKNKKVEAFIW